MSLIKCFKPTFIRH